MTNKYFSNDPQRAGKVNDLFAIVAPRYDFINDLQSFGLHRLWKAQLIRTAAVKPGDEALDVCCGTGDITLRLAAAGARATGLDFSRPMLDVAEKRAAILPKLIRPLHFIQGDALHLPFESARFDIVTVSYGLRNLADFDAGLGELIRVLRPGGRLLILDFGKPACAPWRWIYFQYLRWACPVFGRLFCGDADTHGYILESLKAYPAQNGVDQALEAYGFQQRRIFNLVGGMMSLNSGCKPPA